MKHIDTPHAVDGKFKDKDTDTNFPGTEINASYMNTLQDEICNVITESGIEIDPADSKQMSISIDKRITTASKKISDEVTSAVGSSIESTVASQLGDVDTKIDTKIKVEIDKVVSTVDTKIATANDTLTTDINKSVDTKITTANDTLTTDINKSVDTKLEASANDISAEVLTSVTTTIDNKLDTKIKVEIDKINTSVDTKITAANETLTTDINKSVDLKIEASANDINNDVMSSVATTIDTNVLTHFASIKTNTVLITDGSEPSVTFDPATKTFTFHLIGKSAAIDPKPEPESIPGLKLKTIGKRGLVVGFGDSYVDGTSSETLVNGLELSIAAGSNAYPAYSTHGLLSGYGETGTIEFEILDAGAYGTKASEATKRVDVVKALNPDVVVLRFGTNELSGGNSGIPDNAIVFKASMESIVKQFAPVPVVIVPQNKLKDYADEKVKELNDAITEIVATNANTMTFAFEAFKDGNWDMFMPDNTHPNSLGYILMGQDIRKAVDTIVKSTWKPVNVLTAKLENAYVPVPVPSVNGATGTQPTGWYTDGPAVHVKEEEFHKMVYTGGKGGAAAKITSDAFTNTTDKVVKIAGSVIVKASDLMGFDTDKDWNISDKISLMVQGSGADWNLNFSYSVNSMDKTGDVPLITLVTKPIDIQPTKGAMLTLMVKGGSEGGSTTAWFKDAELFIVE